jgi:hypothetical protein
MKWLLIYEKENELREEVGAAMVNRLKRAREMEALICLSAPRVQARCLTSPRKTSEGN